METNAVKAQTRATPPAMKHWLLQVVPPLLMFYILLMTASGTSLVFITGFLILPVLFSLISIIAKLIFFNKKKRYLLRPILTIAVFFSILAIANWTYQNALVQAIEEARVIHQHCNQNGVCPEKPAGWTRDGTTLRKNDLGSWLTYIALYNYDSASFSMRVYQGPDIGDVINGGIGIPFEVIHYVEQ